jgi:hypothetical protein
MKKCGSFTRMTASYTAIASSLELMHLLSRGGAKLLHEPDHRVNLGVINLVSHVASLLSARLITARERTMTVFSHVIS